MSIFRMRIPVDSQTIIWQVKQRCLKYAIMDKRRRIFSLSMHCHNIYRTIQSNNVPQIAIEDIESKVHAYKYCLRKVYISKFKWILKHQVINIRHTKLLPLEDVVTIIGDFTIPMYIEELIRKGSTFSILQHTNSIREAPAIESQ